MTNIVKHSRIKWTKSNDTEGIGTPGTKKLSQMNRIVSNYEIRVKIKATGLNKFQRRYDTIPCIFHNVFFFKPFAGRVVQNSETPNSF